MKRSAFNYFYNPQGSSPGTLTTADTDTNTSITAIEYDGDRYEYQTQLTPEDCAILLQHPTVSWVDVAGLGDLPILEKLGEIFGLHPLILEAVVNVPQRPKIEDRQERLVIITQMANLKPYGRGFWLEQVSLILGKNYVLSLQEEPERDCNENFNGSFQYFYSFNFYCRYLRHELQPRCIPFEYARTKLVFWLSFLFGNDECDRHNFNCLFLAQGLA